MAVAAFSISTLCNKAFSRVVLRSASRVAANSLRRRDGDFLRQNSDQSLRFRCLYAVYTVFRYGLFRFVPKVTVLLFAHISEGSMK